MPKEKLNEKLEVKEEDFENVRNFRELLALLKSTESNLQEYFVAYEEAATLAVNMVDQKNKSSWDANDFTNKYSAKASLGRRIKIYTF